MAKSKKLKQTLVAFGGGLLALAMPSMGAQAQNAPPIAELPNKDSDAFKVFTGCYAVRQQALKAQPQPANGKALSERIDKLELYFSDQGGKDEDLLLAVAGQNDRINAAIAQGRYTLQGLIDGCLSNLPGG